MLWLVSCTILARIVASGFRVRRNSPGDSILKSPKRSNQLDYRLELYEKFEIALDSRSTTKRRCIVRREDVFHKR